MNKQKLKELNSEQLAIAYEYMVQKEFESLMTEY